MAPPTVYFDNNVPVPDRREQSTRISTKKKKQRKENTAYVIAIDRDVNIHKLRLGALDTSSTVHIF